MNDTQQTTQVMPLLAKETRALPVRLTTKEVEVQSRRMAELLGEITEEESAIKAAKAASKGKLEGMHEEVQRLRGNVMLREETRQVECELRADTVAGLARCFRNDDGSETANRPLTVEEKQLKLEGLS